MVTIKLAGISMGNVLLFDGYVLEVLGGNTCRVHVSHTDNIELKTDRGGHHFLVMDYGSWPNLQVDEAAFPKVTGLVAEVKEAKAEYRFD